MKSVVVYSYILFFIIVSLGQSVENFQKRELASTEISRCEELIKPLLSRQKLTKDFMEVFEKNYLTREEVSFFKESKVAIDALKSFHLSFEEQNYAFAIMALLKKRYHHLDIESIVVHYKSIYRKC